MGVASAWVGPRVQDKSNHRSEFLVYTSIFDRRPPPLPVGLTTGKDSNERPKCQFRPSPIIDLALRGFGSPNHRLGDKASAVCFGQFCIWMHGCGGWQRLVTMVFVCKGSKVDPRTHRRQRSSAAHDSDRFRLNNGVMETVHKKEELAGPPDYWD